MEHALPPEKVLQAEERLTEVRTELYKQFRDEDGYTDFIDRLSERDRAMVLVSSLYQQVNNGGFCQWDHNGYNDHRVLPALRDIGPKGTLVAGWIEEMTDQGLFEELEEEDELREQEMMDALHDYDDMFYQGTGREMLVELAARYFGQP